MEKETNTKDASSIYEVSYLLLPSLATEQVPAKVGLIHETIEKAGGEVISQENPTLIDLAYPMVKVAGTFRQKCQQGYFGWVKFELPDGKIADVKKSLDGSDDILRYLIVKTVRENTLVSGKMNLKKEEVVKKEDVVEEVVPEEPSSPEEIDKSIDDLVIV